MNRQSLDAAPILVIFLAFALVMLVAYEVGFRVGRWWQDRTPGEQEGPTGVLVGSLLALMAFLLGITMGMASDRFDTRRGRVLEEANTIRAAYLQAGYLRSPESEQTRELLREYAALRVATNDDAALQASMTRSEEDPRRALGDRRDARPGDRPQRPAGPLRGQRDPGHPGA